MKRPEQQHTAAAGLAPPRQARSSSCSLPTRLPALAGVGRPPPLERAVIPPRWLSAIRMSGQRGHENHRTSPAPELPRKRRTTADLGCVRSTRKPGRGDFRHLAFHGRASLTAASLMHRRRCIRHWTRGTEPVSLHVPFVPRWVRNAVGSLPRFAAGSLSSQCRLSYLRRAPEIRVCALNCMTNMVVQLAIRCVPAVAMDGFLPPALYSLRSWHTEWFYSGPGPGTVLFRL